MTTRHTLFSLLLGVFLFACFSTLVSAAEYAGDIEGYCKQVAEVSGGSYAIESGCREMEAEARSTLSRMDVPQRIIQYCSNVADVSGKSYSIMVGCIEMEIEAKNKL